MRILVVYYSFTGNTRRVSELLAARLGADTAEFTCMAYRRGLLGGLRQAWDVLTGGRPPIEVPASATGRYDLVVAAGPVWAGRPAPPLRSFVSEHLRSHDAIALFLTCNGTAKNFPGEKALGEIASAAPRAPTATRLFKEAEIASPDIEQSVAAFADVLVRIASKPTAAAGG
ncbi:flavodoxin family protein [Devosia nitrariae]|uniref:Flavodoxin n=1 Tax=Devosia nitrariae TaxID=2071872 RepID=A0ABQ5W9Y2_9HYPH|nr:hypothetical protein [Devosia nitrariae]GLQ56644.1 hypothetical protein GCM10010862_39030 [Devosia nitrariae]